MITYDKLFIGGQWVEPASSEMLEVFSPHDQSLVGRAAIASPADVDRAVAAARNAFDKGPWPHTTPLNVKLWSRSSMNCTLPVPMRSQR